MNLIICRNYIYLRLYKNIDNKRKYWSILLFNEKRIRIKRFRNFENISDKEYDFIQIKYSYVYRISSKTFYKGSRIESIEDAKK